MGVPREDEGTDEAEPRGALPRRHRGRSGEDSGMIWG